MQNLSDKKNKNANAEQDALYDQELQRKAQESYRLFAEKVAERNQDKNSSVNYPIYWQFNSQIKPTETHKTKNSE